MELCRDRYMYRLKTQDYMVNFTGLNSLSPQPKKTAEGQYPEARDIQGKLYV